MNKKIIEIEPYSIAEELEISVGSQLVSINDQVIKDVFDYRYIIQNEFIEVTIIDENGELVVYEIEKDEYEDLGLVFEDGLMDIAYDCDNQCIFCFVHQNPKGLRKTLYFKDDDIRLSFLSGNYVTLTNLTDEQLIHVIKYKLSPINVSVHTTNLDLRSDMLKNDNARNLFKILDKLIANGIVLNFQVVLCKNVNDKIELDKTISDLGKYIGKARSLSIVPVGISKHRENLFELELFTKQDYIQTIEIVQKYQDKFLNEFGTRFVYLSDEFYLSAGLKLPTYEEYEDFPQLDNGVGSISLFKNDIIDALKDLPFNEINKTVSIATGTLAYDFMVEVCKLINEKLPNIMFKIYPIKNNFFGELVTVSGLIVGGDMIKQLTGKGIEKLFIPKNMLKTGDVLFLDNMSLCDVEKELGCEIIEIEVDGFVFLENITK